MDPSDDAPDRRAAPGENSPSARTRTDDTAPTRAKTDDTPLARTRIDDERPSDALLRAAERAHVGLGGCERTLHDQADADALDRLLSALASRPVDGECRVRVDLWDCRFVVTPGVVEVYERE